MVDFSAFCWRSPSEKVELNVISWSTCRAALMMMMMCWWLEEDEGVEEERVISKIPLGHFLVGTSGCGGVVVGWERLSRSSPCKVSD